MILDHQDNLVRLVSLDHQDLQGTEDQQGQWVFQELLVLLVHQVRKVSLDHEEM